MKKIIEFGNHFVVLKITLTLIAFIVTYTKKLKEMKLNEGNILNA